MNNFQKNLLSREELKWIIGAASATASCGGGLTLSCSGSACVGNDKSHCQCTKSDGSIERKDCPVA